MSLTYSNFDYYTPYTTYCPFLYQADGSFITGAVGPDTGGLSIDEGKAAARLCALNLIATLKSQLGDLDRVEQIIKVMSYGFGIVCFSCMLYESSVAPI